MPPPLVVSLLVLVSLPMVPWASRLTFDLVPETGSLDPRALAAFRAAADRWWSRFYSDVTIHLAAGMKPLPGGTPGPTASRMIADSYSDVRAPRIADSNLDNNADNIDRPTQRTYADARALGVLINSPYFIGAAIDLHPDCGSGTSAGLINFSADSRSRFLSVDIGITGIAQFATGKKFSDAGQAGHGKDGSGMEIANPGAPAGRWLRIGHGDVAALDAIGWNRLETAPEPERLTLCLIGLLAMVPSLLRRRGEAGGKHDGRSRRFQTGRYRIT